MLPQPFRGPAPKLHASMRHSRGAERREHDDTRVDAPHRSRSASCVTDSLGNTAARSSRTQTVYEKRARHIKTAMSIES
jgi:hypothetical protein